jgi:hypothetical protein
MGNLGEKIRQILEGQAQQQRETGNQLQGKKGEEKRFAIEDRGDRHQNLLVAKKIFSNVRPDNLLEEVRKDIYKGVGGKVTVSEDESRGAINVILGHEEKGERPKPIRPQGDGVDTPGKSARGKYYDCFEIFTHGKGFVITFYDGFVDLSERYSKSNVGLTYQSEETIKRISLDGENYLKAKKDLETAIISIIISRVLPDHKK